MLSPEQFAKNWNEIKAGVRIFWGNLSDEELESTRGNLGAIAALVQERYGETKDSINQKLTRLMESFDNETDKSDLYVTSFERSPIIDTHHNSTPPSQHYEGTGTGASDAPSSTFDQRIQNGFFEDSQYGEDYRSKEKLKPSYDPKIDQDHHAP